MKRLLKFLFLNHSDRLLLINTFLLLLFVNLGLWLLPFSQLRTLLNKINQPNISVNQTTIGKIIWAVDVSTKFVPGAKCLARALTCQVLMTRRGYSPELRIGVAKDEQGKLEAHAWIENQGKVVIGHLANLSSYKPLPSLPRNGL
ncbi:lasso peptide biosynthesis B2 protein [Anabaena sp. CA = ATCC 33047]|uniref:lasso peptide biosynthesis B2 protein n=1 Tax=Anabaena sp. (strain CA / ATCC 33047) TaxID=52271 RepID=UPI000835E827|nr:lasso peptide biosynthesis B2 protein [Anabaena sp. CA = ATCC 33047]